MATLGRHPERPGSDTDEKLEISHHELPVKQEQLEEKIADSGAAYAAALAAGGLPAWSRAAFTIYGCALLAFCCSCGNGYDGSLMTSINAMPYYQAQFNSGRLGSKTGIIFSIYTVGQMAGSWFAGPISDKYGRRGGMFVGCAVIIAGVAVISTAAKQGQFIGGRFLLGMGIAIATVGAPTYILECSPPQWRGRLTSLYNTGWFGGAIPAAAVTLATSKMQSHWSWKIPLILQAVPATIVCSTVWFMPETPRFLYANGREAEAFEFLVKYHGNGDPNNAIVKLEMEEFRENIKLDGTDKRWWDYSALVNTNNARWRSLMVFLMGLFGQMSGNGLGYFNLDIYKSLGYDSHMQFSMNLISQCVSAFCSWVAVSLSDRMPRRKVLFIGTFACCLMLAANAAFSAKWASFGKGPKILSYGQAGAASFFLFQAVYSFTYTPLQSLYPAECLETTTRAKGVSMKIFVIGGTSFINLLCIPIALQSIQWRLILVFVFWDFFESIIWYFCAIETQGRTLEELDAIFSAPNPVKASKVKVNRTLPDAERN